jgi:hypothetical protein
LIELRARILQLFPLAIRGRLKNLILGGSFKYRPYSS